jgi:hypothetical protein
MATEFVTAVRTSDLPVDVLAPPATVPVTVYPTRVQGDALQIEL